MRDYPHDKAHIAQLAIELHTTLEASSHLHPEIALVAIGATLDATGAAQKEIDARALRYILDAYPEVENHCAFIELFMYQYKKTHDEKFFMIAEAARNNHKECSHMILN
ncbi:hypothetical protein [Paenibacillus sp. 481]|uniref:hypothetical protein n=1 Tax=Paenibacillus sp. 481 TaxID=2835869 RepID=UPI001E2A0E85|nr:hypothetical protein [Paenibacillus sp. 481]UHA72716.1 hypothetical protein KIK04_19070 [Paenibacillus sp. 481]